MESSILSEVDDTSILRTGLPTPLCPSSQLATGLSPLAPAQRAGAQRLCAMARRRTEGGAKPVRLCPCSSDVNLFSYGEGIVDFDAEIPDSALDLCVS